MGSTSCVKCGANLISHSFCGVCGEVLYFKCSSCLTNTDERIHVYCQQIDTLSKNIDSFQDINKLNKMPNAKLFADDYYIKQNQLNDDIKLSSINLSTIYWSNIFEFIKLINKYWADAFNTSINNSVTILYN